MLWREMVVTPLQTLKTPELYTAKGGPCVVCIARGAGTEALLGTPSPRSTWGSGGDAGQARAPRHREPTGLSRAGCDRAPRPLHARQNQLRLAWGCELRSSHIDGFYQQKVFWFLPGELHGINKIPVTF